MKPKAVSKKKMSAAMIVYYIILTFAAIIILVPFVWMVATSFDRVQSYGLPYPPRLIPHNPSLFNYNIATKNMPIFRYLGNTVIITAISVALNCVTATLSGFCLSKGRFPGKNFLMMIILMNMMVPFESKLMPVYKIIQGLGLNNTYLGVALPSVLTNAMFIFFIKKYCDDLPYELYEAGIMDGASKFGIYLKIFLPLMGPVVATMVILNIMNCWNDLLWPMIVLTKPEMYTVQVGLAMFSTAETSNVHAGVATALSVLSILPLSFCFMFLQKYIIQSIAATGIKQ